MWPEEGRAHATEETWKLPRTLGDPKGHGSHCKTWSRDVAWPTEAGKDGRCENRLGGPRRGLGDWFQIVVVIRKSSPRMG